MIVIVMEASGCAVYVQPEKEEKRVHQGCTYHHLITLTCSPNLFSNVNSQKKPSLGKHIFFLCLNKTINVFKSLLIQTEPPAVYLFRQGPGMET